MPRNLICLASMIHVKIKIQMNQQQQHKVNHKVTSQVNSQGNHQGKDQIILIHQVNHQGNHHGNHHRRRDRTTTRRTDGAGPGGTVVVEPVPIVAGTGVVQNNGHGRPTRLGALGGSARTVSFAGVLCTTFLVVLCFVFFFVLLFFSPHVQMSTDCTYCARVLLVPKLKKKNKRRGCWGLTKSVKRGRRR